mmetsp:Transcript_35017/g.71443  ORF Transcript_35017/g.71443 Transcript_35017/m.71443 type:complete len:297 (-) Transcript_35017:271-1161(-)
MFIVRDTRKIGEILDEGSEDDLKNLKLSRRKGEFREGVITSLCRSSTANKLRKTEVLNLYANQLTSVKNIHFGFSTGCLRDLNLGSNLLSELPDELAQVKTLEKLWLDDNHLAAFPSCVLELENLVLLRLSKNRLTALPPQVRMLTKLADLCVDNNELAEVPEALNDLLGLTNLNLRQNSLNALPDLGCLVRLKTLAVSSNQLEQAPPGLERLVCLEGLYLNGNKLTEFPVGALELRELAVLNVANNAIQGPLPPTVVEKWGGVNERGTALKSDGEIQVTVRGNPCTAPSTVLAVE